MYKKLLLYVSIALLAFVAMPDAYAQRKTMRKGTTQNVQKQNGKITGSVRYKYNDYQGFKTDVGAVVYALPVEALQDIASYEDIKKYEDLAGKKTQYLLAIKELDGNKTLAFMSSHYYESDDKILEELDSKMVNLIAALKSKKVNMALIDAGGTYTMELPYGEYFIVFKSKNRERPTVSELTGRFHVEKILLNTLTELVECDFDY